MLRSLLMALCCTLLLTATEASAKRAAPPHIAAIIHDGVKYTALQDNGREGRIEARKADTNLPVWTHVIYVVPIDPNLEEDVQWVFITSLAIEGDTLKIGNEKGEEFTLDLKTRKVTKRGK